MRKRKLSTWGCLGGALWLLSCPASLPAQAASGSWPPLANGERLAYKLLWPSGLSLGEAVLQASLAGKEVHLNVTVDAALPQRHVSYVFSAVATEELCSLRFRQRIQEGSRSWEETVEFDQEKHEVRRTRNGQRSVASVPVCARDPLTLLYHFRQQLAFQQLSLGTVKPGAFHLGADFSVRYEAVTPETVQLGTKAWEGDRFLVTYAGPNGENSFEVWIRPDPSRAPVAVKMQFPLATFAAELQ